MARMAGGMIAFFRKIRVLRGQNVFVRRMGGGSAALRPLRLGSVSSVTRPGDRRRTYLTTGPALARVSPHRRAGESFCTKMSQRQGPLTKAQTAATAALSEGAIGPTPPEPLLGRRGASQRTPIRVRSILCTSAWPALCPSFAATLPETASPFSRS